MRPDKNVRLTGRNNEVNSSSSVTHVLHDIVEIVKHVVTVAHKINLKKILRRMKSGRNRQHCEYRNQVNYG